MNRFRRLATVLAPAAAVVLAGPVMAGPADALTKERESLPLTDHLLLDGMCDFPVVTSDVRGHITQTLVFDDEGNLVRIEIRFPGVRSEFTNVETGESVTVNNSGPVTVYPLADGTLKVVQRGQSVSGDQGVLTGNPFLIHHTGRIVTIAVPPTDPDADFFNFESQVRTGHTTDLCAVLAD